MTTPKPVQPAHRPAPETDMDTDHTASIDAVIQGALGRKLRETYEEVVREEIPDKLLQLLDQLKEAETCEKRKTDKA